MGEYTKIYNRFKSYTVRDCDCIFCLHYDTKKKRCPLPRCCCEEERAQAILPGAPGESGDHVMRATKGG